ncbi:Dps family protein [Celeribacter persicus]|jgi:DNA-binding ferritin-like protein (oxidative damage protectant)|uniref:Starvation-inducible DNA-binding protein n=1 Tax=Celeribacter persicus TaxID=1651082 RepID=A0A2T5HPC1_9RHOB|nr:DNA starvation/stationary phase protection protein [Celeribacter persicus]PTQ73409.1 starvation-inducible DNA-binding protein [Celeribacter persicus]
MTVTSNKACSDAVARVLADTYMLYMKAHNFHWNVEGPKFISLHAMFEEQYTDLAAAMDDLAERIRALGEYAPGTHAQFAALASVTETEGQLSAEDMLRETVKDYETIGETLKAGIELADEQGDDVTSGMLADRLEYHQKQLWMMRSLLK